MNSGAWRIWTNADQANQAEEAIAFGAEGIGLTRTEHMFFEGNRIDAVRQMILARTTRAGSGRWPRSCPCKRRISRASSASCEAGR